MASHALGGVPARRSNSDGGIAHRCLIGFVGGLLGAAAMNLFSRAVSSARNGREATGAAPGYDRVGRGVQPPQADGAAEEDATVRVGTAAYRAVTGSAPDRAKRSWLGTSMHYAFGGTVGACYAVMAQRLPIIRAGHGTAYGTAVWIVADEMIMPLLGVSRGPRQLPAGVHAYALSGHWVYGLTLESTLRSWSRDQATNPQKGEQHHDDE
jgi:putative membrane protein